MNKEKYYEYLKELNSFEYETVKYDRHGDIFYDINNNPSDLIRLPKYNRFESDYKKVINKKVSDAWNEICNYDIKIKERIFNRLKQIKGEFEKYWNFHNKYSKSINNGSIELEYHIFLNEFRGLFEKFEKIERSSWDNEYGHITLNFMYDLADAIFYKESSLDKLMNQLEKDIYQ